MASLITLRHLEAFRSIMLNKTVTNAAAAMHVSQPVVTRLLADFERRIGIQLFKRERGRLHATPEAKVLYEEVKRSLAGVERISTAAAEMRALKRGSLRIAAAPSLALDFLPQAIGRFLEDHPNVNIQLLMHSTPSVMDRVREGRCDIGFVILSLPLQSNHCQLFMSTKLVCVVPKNHRLAKNTVIAPPDLQGERFVSYPHQLDTRGLIDATFAAHQVERILNAETQISYALLRLVEAGAGVALIDPLTASCHPDAQVRYIPFDAHIPMNFSLMTVPDQTPSNLQKPFIDFIRAEILHRIPPELLIYPNQAKIRS